LNAWHFKHSDAGYLPGTNATTGDPQFLNQSASDYHPAPGSPMTNRGAPIVPVDINNEFRSSGSTSIGAFE